MNCCDIVCANKEHLLLHQQEGRKQFAKSVANKLQQLYSNCISNVSEIFKKSYFADSGDFCQLFHTNFTTPFLLRFSISCKFASIWCACSSAVLSSWQIPWLVWTWGLKGKVACGDFMLVFVQFVFIAAAPWHARRPICRSCCSLRAFMCACRTSVASSLHTMLPRDCHDLDAYMHLVWFYICTRHMGSWSEKSIICNIANIVT